MTTPLRLFLLDVVLFFAIGAGLGYQPLNRYDPRVRDAVSDVGAYATSVTGDAPNSANTPRRYRQLVPLLARPIYHLVRGRLGSWDPVLFALLVVNAAFMAVGAATLTRLVVDQGLGAATGLLSSCLLLLNFLVANYFLAGMVDAAELCGAVLLAFALQRRRWWLLVLLLPVTALAKETFAVLGTTFALGWWLASDGRGGGSRHWRPLAWIAGGAVLAVAAVVAVRWTMSGVVTTPLGVAASYGRPASGLGARLWSIVGDPDFWYGLAWLLPLALPGVRAMSRPWIAGSAAAAGTACLLGAWAVAGGGNVARPVFSMLGPLLCVAAATTLLRLHGAHDAPPGGGERARGSTA